MDTTDTRVEQVSKTLPCFCTAAMGALVIVFAWWRVSWAAIALTVLGALIVVRGLVNRCCCAESSTCGSAPDGK